MIYNKIYSYIQLGGKAFGTPPAYRGPNACIFRDFVWGKEEDMCCMRMQGTKCFATRLYMFQVIHMDERFDLSRPIYSSRRQICEVQCEQTETWNIFCRCRSSPRDSTTYILYVIEWCVSVYSQSQKELLKDVPKWNHICQWLKSVDTYFIYENIKDNISN